MFELSKPVYKPVSERVQFDDANDIVIIDGVRVDAHVLTSFTTPTPPGRWFRVIDRNEFNFISIETRNDPVVNVVEQGAST